MSIKKAVQRIGWRIKENHFKANKNDIQAFNTIVDYVESQEQKKFKQTPNFAKLYLFVYGQFLRHYNANVFNQIPKQEINKILDTSFEDLLSNFHNDLNQLAKDQMIDKLETEEDFKKLSESGKYMENPFDFEYVKTNIINQINEVSTKSLSWKN